MRERERESSIADMNDLLVTNEQVALRRENANVFLLKFAHTRVSLLSSIDINMTTTTTRRRKQKRSSSSSLHSSSSSSSAPSSSSSPSRRAMMTLLLLLFGTISDVFVVRATWPIVRYKNGTVGVKNDGGTVKVQSTDLIVDGNLSVSGSLFLQDRDLAEYEDRVSSLENAKYEERVAYLESVIQSHASALAGMSGSSASPPKCIPPGGDKLRFDGEKWICVCINSYYYGDECQYKTPYEPVTDDNIHAECFRCLGVSLHGLCYDSPHGPMPDWNVSLVTEMHDLFSHYFYCKNANDNICKFMTWANVDISKWNTERVTNMYNMFYYASAFNQDIGGWNTAQVTSMQNMFFVASAFNHYIGDWDTSKLRSYSNIFRDATAFQAKYTCASSSSNSVKPSSCKTVRSTWIAPPPPPSPPLPPPPPLSPPTDSVTINGKQLYQDSDGWILLLAYEHKAGENNALVSKTAPSSPTEGYSHIWLEDLGLAASDVDSVKFYCKTSAHSRVMHFSSSTDFVKNAIVDGSCAGNQASYWNSGTTKFDDHTTNLPDATAAAYGTDLFEYPFFSAGSYHWAIGALDRGQYRWECDDFAWNSADTLHQIWFKRKSSSGA